MAPRIYERNSPSDRYFFKDYFAANQKSLRLPVQKLWPIMWFLQIFLKSRDVKTWRRTSNGATLPEAEFYVERSATNQKFLPLPVQKLWAIICFVQKWWPWPCPISDFQKKKFCIVACLDDIFCKKNQDDRTSDATCRAFEDRQTNKQTDRPRWPIYFPKIEDFEK